MNKKKNNNVKQNLFNCGLNVSEIPRITCAHRSAPRHGSYQEGSKTTWYRNEEATFLCDSGYTLIGIRTSLCSSTGTWSSDVPICERTIQTPVIVFIYRLIDLNLNADLHIMMTKLPVDRRNCKECFVYFLN